MRIKQLKFLEKNSSSFKIVRDEIDSLLRDKLIKKIIQIISLFVILEFLAVAVFWVKLPPQLPLIYSRPWGEEQLVVKNLILLIPVSCLVFNFFNIRIAGLFFKKELILSQIVVWSSLIICFVTSITLIKVLILCL